MNDAALARTVVSSAQHTLSEGLRKIEHCVAQLTDEQIWWRPRPEMNSIANLMLHLSGNLRQWIVSGIGGAKYVRNRPAEFADRSQLPKQQLLATLRSAVEDSNQTLAKLTADDLIAPRRIQGYDLTVTGAIFDAIPHFRGHVQEIIHMTRTQLGERYKLYFVPQGKEQESAGE